MHLRLLVVAFILAFCWNQAYAQSEPEEATTSEKKASDSETQSGTGDETAKSEDKASVDGDAAKQEEKLVPAAEAKNEASSADEGKTDPAEAPPPLPPAGEPVAPLLPPAGQVEAKPNTGLQAPPPGFSEVSLDEASPVKPPLNLLDLHGYLRLRGDLMDNLTLGSAAT